MRNVTSHRLLVSAPGAEIDVRIQKATMPTTFQQGATGTVGNFQGYLWSLVPNWTNGVPVIGGNVIFNQGTLHGESALRAAPAEASSVAIGRITDPGSSVGSVFSRRRL